MRCLRPKQYVFFSVLPLAKCSWQCVLALITLQVLAHCSTKPNDCNRFFNGKNLEKQIYSVVDGTCETHRICIYIYYIQRRATKNHRVLCKRNATNRNANSFRDFSSSRVTFICYFFLLISFQFAMLLLCCVRPATQLIPIYWKRTLKNTFRGKTYNLLFDIC